MSVEVKLRYLRISPRKVRQVADLIRGKKATKAQTLLAFTVKKPFSHLKKLLESGIDAAEKKNLDTKNLVISKILVNEGPTLKRWRAGSRGQPRPIDKRTSHVILTLSEKEKKKSKISKNTKNKAQKKKKSKSKAKK